MVALRPGDSHKGENGKVLVIGGSYRYTGAPALSALSVLRAGGDIAVILAPDAVSNAIRGFSPNLIVWDYKGKTLNEEAVQQVSKVLEDFDTFVIGPGLVVEGGAPSDRDALRAILRLLREKPVVADAGALHLLAAEPKLIGRRWVLTPHRGEFGVLVGNEKDVKALGKEAKVFAKKNKCTIIVKGNPDIISDGRGITENHTGNPGMTVGGTGDVLTGVIATFMCKKSPFEATRLGAFANGVAGDYAFQKYGVCLMATDVIDSLPHAIIHMGDICGETKGK